MNEITLDRDAQPLSEDCHAGFLHHVAIRTNDIEATGEFYATMLGFWAGPRPPFGIPGLWLCGKGSYHAVLHVIESPGSEPSTTGLFDHFSFSARGLDGYIEKIKQRGIGYVLMPIPDSDLVQMQFPDPNGIVVELTFEGERLDS